MSKKLNQPERDQLLDTIVKALNEMPDLFRRTFVLRHYEGLSSDEIATKLGVKSEDIPLLLRRADAFFYRKLQSLVPHAHESSQERASELSSDSISTKAVCSC